MAAIKRVNHGSPNQIMADRSGKPTTAVRILCLSIFNSLALCVLDGAGKSKRRKMLVGLVSLYSTFTFICRKEGSKVKEFLDLHYLFFFGLSYIVYFVHEVVSKFL